MTSRPNTTDSAGQPWAGRRFEANANAEDDGSAPEALVGAIARLREGSGGQAEVVQAFRSCRVLIPLLSVLGEIGYTEDGRTVDKSQELSVVTVEGPDGRTVLPVFSSVAALSAWNSRARPVPVSGPRAAAAAASEGTDLVVIDPTAPTEFVVRRPALWAIVQEREWVPSFGSEEVARAFALTVAEESAVRGLRLAAGDPDARLHGPELAVTLTLEPGLQRTQLQDLLARLSSRWESSEVIAQQVDSLEVSLTA